ncbi:hypothetical protein [Enhygromyxa salina]|nr:hypothetical protein [Enhygromyxa salina]
MSPRFSERVKQEAREQRALRAAGKPIPASLRIYARRSGLAVTLVCGQRRN